MRIIDNIEQGNVLEIINEIDTSDEVNVRSEI